MLSMAAPRYRSQLKTGIMALIPSASCIDLHPGQDSGAFIDSTGSISGIQSPVCQLVDLSVDRWMRIFTNAVRRIPACGENVSRMRLFQNS
jgi:hypothetical protein